MCVNIWDPYQIYTRDHMILLLFDLDHTLIHSAKHVLNEEVESFTIAVDKYVMQIHVRPYALQLIEYICNRAVHGVEFGFWTAATAEYAELVLTGLFARVGVSDWRSKAKVLYTRDDTVVKRGLGLVKDLELARVDFPEHAVYLIDDDPVHETEEGNRGCVFRVPPFHAHCHETVRRDTCLRMFTDQVRVYDEVCDDSRRAEGVLKLPPILNHA